MVTLKMMRECAFPFALVSVLGLVVTAALASASKSNQAKDNAKPLSPEQMVVNPSQIMGTCSYRVGTTPHTLTLLRADLPFMSVKETDAILQRVPRKDFYRYMKNMAYLVIDTAQSSKPHSKVVWGTYATNRNTSMPSAQKMMGSIVWSAKTNTAYAILGQTNGGLCVSIYVYHINIANNLTPLPLKLEATSRLPSLSDVQPLVETECETGFDEVKVVQASATPQGLKLHFLRDYPDENRAEYLKAPLDIFLNLTTHQWSSTDNLRFGRFPTDRL